MTWLHACGFINFSLLLCESMFSSVWYIQMLDFEKSWLREWVLGNFVVVFTAIIVLILLVFRSGRNPIFSVHNTLKNVDKDHIICIGAQFTLFSEIDHLKFTLTNSFLFIFRLGISVCISHASLWKLYSIKRLWKYDFIIKIIKFIISFFF